MTRTVPLLVVLQPRTLLLDVAGPMEAVRKANQVQDEVRFEVRYVAPTPMVETSIGLTLRDLTPLPERVEPDVTILVSGSASSSLGESEWRSEASDDTLVRWLAETVRPEHRLVTICSGAIAAGHAGLFDGAQCTTHHDCIAELKAVAPQATVARYLVVYLRREGSDPQLSPWLDGRNHLHRTVHRAQDAVAAGPARDWSVATLASVAGASPRNLSRLFNQHAGMTIVDHVARIRVALARELLTQTSLDMESVAERTGFASARQLRRAWAREHAYPPRAVRSEISA